MFANKPVIFKAHLMEVMHDSPYRSFTHFGIKVEHEPVQGVHNPPQRHFYASYDPIYGPYGRPGRSMVVERGPMQSTFRISDEDFRVLQHLFLREDCREIEVLQPTRDFVVLQSIGGWGQTRWQAQPNHVVAQGGHVLSYYQPSLDQIPHGRFIENDRNISRYSSRSYGISDFEDSMRMMRDIEYQYQMLHGKPIAQIPQKFLDVPKIDPAKFAAQVAELMKPPAPPNTLTVEDAARQVLQEVQKANARVLLAAVKAAHCSEVLAEAILALDKSAKFNRGRWQIRWKNGSTAQIITTSMENRLCGPRFTLAWIHGECTKGFLTSVGHCCSGKVAGRIIQTGHQPKPKLPDSHKGLGVMFGRMDLI